MNHVVLDLCAGSGVGVAVRELGAEEKGVEIMPEAIATRELNGMETVYNDIWDVHLAEGVEHDTQWGSPPCPTFSAAGKGSGRKQMPLILDAIAAGLWRDIAELRSWADGLEDARTGLTVVPLHYVWRFRPRHVALEQVPAVLPIWEAYATQMRIMGYSVWTGYLHAEQYGVAQTRKRAYLIAKLDPNWDATPPPPTHSKYHSRTPDRLDGGVKKWVSMAEAIGRLADRPAPTVTGGVR